MDFDKPIKNAQERSELPPSVFLGDNMDEDGKITESYRGMIFDIGDATEHQSYTLAGDPKIMLAYNPVFDDPGLPGLTSSTFQFDLNKDDFGKLPDDWKKDIAAEAHDDKIMADAMLLKARQAGHTPNLKSLFRQQPFRPDQVTSIEQTTTMTSQEIIEKYGSQLTPEQIAAIYGMGKESALKDPIAVKGLNDLLNIAGYQDELTKAKEMSAADFMDQYGKIIAAEGTQGESELPLLSVSLLSLPRSIQVELFIEPDRMYTVDAVGFHGKVKAHIAGRDLSPSQQFEIIRAAIAEIEAEEARSPERSREIMAGFQKPTKEFTWNILGGKQNRYTAGVDAARGGSPTLTIGDEAGYLVLPESSVRSFSVNSNAGVFVNPSNDILGPKSIS